MMKKRSKEGSKNSSHKQISSLNKNSNSNMKSSIIESSENEEYSASFQGIISSKGFLSSNSNIASGYLDDDI